MLRIALVFISLFRSYYGFVQQNPKALFSTSNSFSNILQFVNLKLMSAAKNNDNNYVETRPVGILEEGMKMRRLPTSDLIVSELCLGTMNFGDQLNKEQSFELLDKATKEFGINFIVSFF